MSVENTRLSNRRKILVEDDFTLSEVWVRNIVNDYIIR